ncbi:hypothetical protein V7266_28375 [Neobacillus drentensis]|uniref:hypothetical protein n=1 Tax=Neobacillus drentensis TaxID=220684 RepID=UPI002FFF7AE4
MEKKQKKKSDRLSRQLCVLTIYFYSLYIYYIVVAFPAIVASFAIVLMMVAFFFFHKKVCKILNLVHNRAVSKLMGDRDQPYVGYFGSLFTILTSLIKETVTFVGIHYRFREVKGKKKIMELIINYIETIPSRCLWIFQLTFGKFKLYLLANLINNLVYAIGIIPFLVKKGGGA